MLRVFVSSTFNDMHLERDCLEEIEQDLNVRLRERGEYIEFIDLRWGISTEGLTDEEKNRAVLEGCCSAIDKSDYLLVFLGHKYGSVKRKKELLNSLGKRTTNKLFRDGRTGKSITELEVTYAELMGSFTQANTVVCIRRSPDDVEAEAGRLIQKYTGNADYADSILHYSSEPKEALKSELKRKLFEIIEARLEHDTRFDRDKKRMRNISADAILNSYLAGFRPEQRLLLISGEKGIGKTLTAAKLLLRNDDGRTLYYVSWEAGQTGITYEQLLQSLCEGFAEWLREAPDFSDPLGYIRSCIERVNNDGYRFVLFLDSANNISNINYRQILAATGDSRIVVTTDDDMAVLAAVAEYNDYSRLNGSHILFTTQEIGDVIRGEFKEHGKTVRDEVVEILSGKKDITKPLYLHFAIKRLLHLKRRDFEKCAAGESPEVAVLAEIAAEMPEEVDALLRYSIDNVCANSDISDELHMALALLGGSHGGITEEALISYLIFNGIGHDRSAVMPYVYEIKNRLEDFIVYDGQWLNRRFALEFYECYSSDDDTLNNVRRFIDVNRTSYRDEYFVRENMYQNRHDGPGLCDLISARCLWKAGNAAVRKMYRRCFWNLMADGSITSETIYDRLYMKAAERYKRLYMEADDKDKLEESVEYELPLICDRDLLFRLLAEGFGHELYNYEKGDCAFILLNMLRIYLEELIFIGNSGYLIAVDEVPVSVLDVFEKTAVLYKSISKVLLNANKVSMNCEKIYSLVLDETVNFKEELNALGFGEMLEIHEEDRPVTYLRNFAYMTSALQFFVSLGTFDSRFRAVSNDVVANLFYFNSECLKDKMFETVKYAIVAYITGWANTLDREARRTPADVCSVRYYVDHPRREQLMHGYADALMLTLILLYELYHLEHFADIDGCPDAACGISKTVLDTAMALNQAASGLKWDNSVTLEEKVSIDMLKYVLIMTVVKLSLSETQTRQLYSALRVDEFMKIDSLHAAVINPDLNSFLPPHIEEVFDSGADGENAIKNEIIKAVRELNLICL